MALLCIWMGLFLPESSATDLIFGPRGGRGEKFAYLALALIQDSAQDIFMSRYVRHKSGVQFTRFYRTPFVSKGLALSIDVSLSTPLHVPTPAVPLLTTEIAGGIHEVRVGFGRTPLAGTGFGRVVQSHQRGSWEARLRCVYIARPWGYKIV